MDSTALQTSFNSLVAELCGNARYGFATVQDPFSAVVTGSINAAPNQSNTLSEVTGATEGAVDVETNVGDEVDRATVETERAFSSSTHEGGVLVQPANAAAHAEDADRTLPEMQEYTASVATHTSAQQDSGNESEYSATSEHSIISEHSTTTEYSTFSEYSTTSELRAARPWDIARQSNISRYQTHRLVVWLINEASKYANIRNRYQRTNQTYYNIKTGRHEVIYSMSTTNDFTVMADIIYQNNALTDKDTHELLSGPRGDTRVDNDFKQELGENVNGRYWVTEWYKKKPCRAGSQLAIANEQHDHFNNVLRLVYQKLKHVHDERS